MTPRKLVLGLTRFPYGGNGATSSEHPDVGDWVASVVLAAKNDERISDVIGERLSDTPITMTRNRAVEWARSNGVDVLIMVDSDQAPDLYVGHDPQAKPFFESSFDFLYAHYEKGPVCVFAPYCGPPMHPIDGGFENPYVFRWQDYHTGHMDKACKLEAYSRAEAAQMTGISEVGAGPTGLCMIDMRLFEHMGLPYFDYEWEGDGPACPHCKQPTPGMRSQKASTEDVFFYRNLSLNAMEKLGYNPVYCNWDAWAGHWKPWCVGKPQYLGVDRVHRHLRDAVLENQPTNRKLMQVVRGERLAQTGTPPLPPAPVEGEKPDPFKFAQNTCPEDLRWLGDVARSEALRLGLGDYKMTLVEIGSWVGDSARTICDAVESTCDYELHCVDHWEGANRVQREAAEKYDAYAEFQRNMGERLGKTVFAHRAASVDAAKEWGDSGARPIDFLFIDADHSYEGCLADITAWSPFVRESGIICGHDYSHLFPGVKKAVHDFFGYDIVVVGSVWMVRKPPQTNRLPANGKPKKAKARKRV